MSAFALNRFVWMIGFGDFGAPGTENAFSRVNTMGRFIEKHTRVAGGQLRNRQEFDALASTVMTTRLWPPSQREKSNGSENYENVDSRPDAPSRPPLHY